MTTPTNDASTKQILPDIIQQSGRPFLPKPFIAAELKTIVRDAIKEAQ